ncbi:hypothetical protein NEF87_003140 [Candidatus Lokiarchaeum ossiferum]|uniref:Uncharacterized protein n=1 Tax=Candidatus Lokiarchaeum ossiferum TaxID=2951803 RepID=A0ABY6HTK9_9ARCH|nr:hypothetical protein NEF87_003140 [Candidatus Lokiarchaeum sp. B-35]
MVAESLEISKKELLELLIGWGEFLSFKIEKDHIVVDDLGKFIESIDSQFATWGEISSSDRKDGKIYEHINNQNEIEETNEISNIKQSNYQQTISERIIRETEIVSFHQIPLIRRDAEVLSKIESRLPIRYFLLLI